MFAFKQPLKGSSVSLFQRFSITNSNTVIARVKPFHFHQKASLFSTKMGDTAQASIAGGPIQQTVHQKFTEAFKPQLLQIRNDSAHHKHHEAMKDSNRPETHFSVKIVSDYFKGMSAIKRHRACFTLLDKEMNTPGMIHALTLIIRTVEEEEKQ
ncbi:hypothetical protein BB561_003806 [Smittium simulii]|uniref:BolA protein n=1 Tax=Smittium simulii TaxID=133385 RepID=A0A2T9YJG5_9FUNG|nr:hypothetical protein BB561_003806 [Smittium simulii]